MSQSTYITNAAASKAPRAAATVHARPERAPMLGPVAVAAFVAVVLGWRTRDEYYVVPDEGLGYGLGIAGLAMMLLLLLYSVRKRWRPLSRVGPVQGWFHVHMLLGILGPTAILFHANFRLGSLNANAALLSMLTVSLSGIVGRFIYTRIHYEYLGRVATLDELRREARSEDGALADLLRIAPEALGVLGSYRESCLVRRSGVLGRAAAFLTTGSRGRRAYRRALRAWRRAAAASGSQASTREVKRALKEQVAAIRRVGEYGAYERAFALWHAFHLPFCVILFLAAAVHVVAVHMY